MIEEFIDALAECYDAKEELDVCGGDYSCRECEQKYSETKVKAEEIMRKIIRTELKVVSDE